MKKGDLRITSEQLFISSECERSFGTPLRTVTSGSPIILIECNESKDLLGEETEMLWFVLTPSDAGWAREIRLERVSKKL